MSRRMGLATKVTQSLYPDWEKYLACSWQPKSENPWHQHRRTKIEIRKGHWVAQLPVTTLHQVAPAHRSFLPGCVHYILSTWDTPGATGLWPDVFLYSIYLLSNMDVVALFQSRKYIFGSSFLTDNKELWSRRKKSDNHFNNWIGKASPLTIIIIRGVKDCNFGSVWQTHRLTVTMRLWESRP